MSFAAAASAVVRLSNEWIKKKRPEEAKHCVLGNGRTAWSDLQIITLRERDASTRAKRLKVRHTSTSYFYFYYKMPDLIIYFNHTFISITHLFHITHYTLHITHLFHITHYTLQLITTHYTLHITTHSTEVCLMYFLYLRSFLSSLELTSALLLTQTCLQSNMHSAIA